MNCGLERRSISARISGWAKSMSVARRHRRFSPPQRDATSSSTSRCRYPRHVLRKLNLPVSDIAGDYSNKAQNTWLAPRFARNVCSAHEKPRRPGGGAPVLCGRAPARRSRWRDGLRAPYCTGTHSAASSILRAISCSSACRSLSASRNVELPRLYTPRSAPPVSTGSGRAIRLRLQRGDLVRSADKAASSYSPEFAIHESEQISWMVRSDRLARC
jgi:hypothetical protein